MPTLLWIILTPIVLGLAAIGLYFLKAIVQGTVEGLRSAGDDDDAYELPEASAALGFLPPERQDTERASADVAPLAAALAAAGAGDWRTVAALLDETAATRDWELRDYFRERLAGLAAEDDSWLLAWEAARPDDPGAALLRASSTVSLAGKIRGSKRARHTTAEQFEGFHRVLARSREEHARAAALAPEEDPTPYIGEIWTAVGLGYPHAAMDRLWKEITARAPHHYSAHYAALQYWCAKWRGSKELAREFAASAARSAPLGSLLTVFPLIAHFEHDESDSADVDRTPGMHALVDAALADAAAADPGHLRLPEVRHLLAYYLALQDRDEAAVEQFRLVDGHVGTLPWRYRSDPAAAYCALRDASATDAAAAV